MTEPQIPLDDWHDQDLLTRDEAAVRLEERMAEATARLAELTEGGAASDEEAGLLERRLAALRTAHAALKD
jgi:hypothetical protein